MDDLLTTLESDPGVGVGLQIVKDLISLLHLLYMGLSHHTTRSCILRLSRYKHSDLMSCIGCSKPTK